MSLDKPIESITESDLQQLLEDSVPEGKTIEYKSALPSNSRRDRIEFLKDVSAFANTAGGHLIYGIEEEEGNPVRICGLHDIDADGTKLCLENRLRDSIKPRIPGISIYPVPLDAGGVVLVLRIPRSWADPHVVSYDHHWRFYSRNSAGAYQLDVQELRGHFLQSETRAESIRRFRADRLGKIFSGETPTLLDEGPSSVLHIIPFGAFDRGSIVDVASINRDDIWKLFPIGESIVSSWRYNLDGLLTCTKSPKGQACRSYLQIFRNGCIEAVDTAFVDSRHNAQPNIPSDSYEHEIHEGLWRFLSIQRRLGVQPPLFVMLSLFGVAGYVIYPWKSYDAFWVTGNAKPIDRDALLLPEVEIDSFAADPVKVLQPVFDALWNASGWPRSLNYDEDGNWLPH